MSAVKLKLFNTTWIIKRHTRANRNIRTINREYYTAARRYGFYFRVGNSIFLKQIFFALSVKRLNLLVCHFHKPQCFNGTVQSRKKGHTTWSIVKYMKNISLCISQYLTAYYTIIPSVSRLYHKIISSISRPTNIPLSHGLPFPISHGLPCNNSRYLTAYYTIILSISQPTIQ